MTNKQGSTTTKLPTQFRSSHKKGKAKNISIDGDELRRCPNCSKRKMLIKHQYEKEGKYYKYSRCGNCEYVNYIPLETKE